MLKRRAFLKGLLATAALVPVATLVAAKSPLARQPIFMMDGVDFYDPIDTESLKAWLAAGNTGRISVMYDQSGSGNDLLGLGLSQQPVVAFSLHRRLY